MPFDGRTPTGQQGIWRVEMLGRFLATRTGYDGSSEDSTRGNLVVERFRTHKTALLLARLALAPARSHSREALVDLLWPDAPVETGRARLAQTLGYLRQALGDPRTNGLIHADHRTIRLTTNSLQTDVADWENEASRALAMSSHPNQLACVSAALGKYRGDLLPGFYDDWVCDERNRLLSLRDALQTRLQTLQAMPRNEIISGMEQRSAVVSRQAEPTIVNAPLYLTRFFGREAESADVCRLLRQDPPQRLVTLLGSGGIGKTRLALAIGREVLKSDDPPSGKSGPFEWSAFVPLAEARTEPQAIGALLGVLGLDAGGSDGFSAIQQFLNTRAARTAGRLLLILDNLEQMGHCSAAVVARLLADIPALTILATSREPVRIPGEQEVLLGSLGRGVAGENGDIPDDVRLFVDRTRLVRSGFTLTPENQAGVTRLCALLEGVPLALELAAAWGRVLAPEQISERFGARLLLLFSPNATAPGQTGPGRHRSLQAAIAWSFDLLEPQLKSFFTRLSVFRGGWTADAARSVTGTDHVEEPLLLLAERSLILVEDNVVGRFTSTRYRMLESLREFASERLSAEDREHLARKHARYFDALTQQVDQPDSSRTGKARPLLYLERDNLRAAIDCGLRQSDDFTRSHDLCIHALHVILQSAWLWATSEFESFMHSAFARLPLLPTDLRCPLEADLLLTRGANALQTGDFDKARPCIEESLAAYEALGNRAGALNSRSRLATLTYQTGDTERAISIWKNCLAESNALGDKRLESAILNNLAVVSPCLEERQAFIQRAVSIKRVHEPGTYLLANSLNTMANTAREQRDFRTAQSCLDEAWELACLDSSNGMQGVVQTSFVELYLDTGCNLDRARELLYDAQKSFEDLGAPTRIAEVHYLGFRLALARKDAYDSLACASNHIRTSRQNGAETTVLASALRDICLQLRGAGFASQAEELEALFVDLCDEKAERR